MEGLIRRVRRATKDRPARAWVADNPLTATATDLTVGAGDIGNFKEAGKELCFDDGTDELVITTGAADSTTNKITMVRGQDGTAGTEHILATAVLIKPRFTNAEIIDAISTVIDNLLWPKIWVPAETTLAYQSTNDYFSPTLPGIDEIGLAYQLVSGGFYKIAAELVRGPFADDANFPNGAIIISSTVDSSTIYLSVHLRPAVDNLDIEAENLTVAGASALLVEAEEMAHVGGATTAVDKTVADGSKLRAGVVLMQRFENMLDRRRVALASAEQQRRHELLGV